MLSWMFVGFLIYTSYAWLYSFQLYTKLIIKANINKKIGLETKDRFKEFEDVEI